MKTICISNHKGGVGKTATAVEMASALTDKGYKVLCIDLDGQGSMSLQFVTKKELDKNKDNTIVNVLVGNVNIKDAIIHTDCFDLILGDFKTEAIDKLLPDASDIFNLEIALREVENDYDFCLIDQPPRLGTVASLGLMAASNGGGVIIPVDNDASSIEGIAGFNSFLQGFKKFGRNIRIIGILKQGFKANYRFDKVISSDLETVAKYLDSTVFKTNIRHCTQFKNAKTHKTSMRKFNIKSTTAKDYDEVVEEFLKLVM